MKLYKIALRNVKRNTRRSILSMTAIAVAAMSITLLFSMINGMTEDLGTNLKRYYTGEIRLRHADYDEYEHINPIALGIDNYKALSESMVRLPQVSAVSPRTTFMTSIYQENGNHNAVGIGVDFLTEGSFMPFDSILKEGRLPSNGAKEALLTSGLARELGLDIGDKFTLLSRTMRGGFNGITLQVTGIVTFPVSQMNTSYFLAPLDTVLYFLKMNGATTEVLAISAEGYTEQEAAAAIAGLPEVADNPIEIKTWRHIGQSYSMLKMAEGIYYVIALMFFILGSTVIVNTTMMVIFERTKEIGTIGAMGMEGPSIVKLFFLEAFFISLIGAGAGVLLGAGISLPLAEIGLDLSDAMQGVDFEISPIIYFKLNPLVSFIIFLYAVLIASAASFLPSRRAARIEPAKALRSI